MNPPSGVQLISTCWLLEPHSFITCNFLMDHRKQPRSLSNTTSQFSFPLQSYGGFLFLQWIHSFCFYCTAHSHFLFSVFFPVYIPFSCLFRGEFKSKEWRKYHFTISVSPHSTVQETSVLLTPSPVQPNHLHNFIYYNFILKTNLWSSCRELVVNTPLNNCNWWMFLVEAAFWKF